MLSPYTVPFTAQQWEGPADSLASSLVTAVTGDCWWERGQHDHRARRPLGVGGVPEDGMQPADLLKSERNEAAAAAGKCRACVSQWRAGNPPAVRAASSWTSDIHLGQAHPISRVDPE